MSNTASSPVIDTRNVDELAARVIKLEAELKSLEAFRELAYRDPLTGLRNRRYFEIRLKEEINRVERGSQKRFSVIMADLNDLKMINDQYGHQAGDRALCIIACSFEKHLRVQDVCCRYGGDEFVLLLPDTGIEGREVLAERILAKQKREPAPLPFPVMASLGGVTWPHAGLRVEDVIQYADQSMYQAKRRMKRALLARGK